MAGETRVTHQRNAGMAVEPGRELDCVRLGPLHSQRKRSDTTGGEEGFHRADGAAVEQPAQVKLVVQLVVGDRDGTGEEITVPADELGC